VAAEVLLPLMEFQARRPMRKQLRNLLEVVKARAEAAGTSSGRDEPKFGGEAPARERLVNRALPATPLARRATRVRRAGAPAVRPEA